MAKKKKRYRPIDPFDAFISAWGFRCAAVAMSERKEVKLLARPTSVNSALALELFLKCIHLVRRRRKAAHGHSMKTLFRNISKSDQNRIKILLEKVVSVHPLRQKLIDEGYELDVWSILDRVDLMFIDLRYWHEKAPLKVDSKGRYSDAGLEALINAVFIFLLELKPDWINRFNQYVKSPPDFIFYELPT